ncbi:MAG: methyltransferase domain-containing protein [Bryobacterales bacterium]|nr:methyltransferase domain-containing protein [Bryobacterales bacterium]
MYADFLQCIADGREWTQPPAQATSPAPAAATPALHDSAIVEEPVIHEPPSTSAEPLVSEAYLKTWARDVESQDYLDIHLTRLRRTLEITPPGAEPDRVLEMGAYLQITPALRTKLGYGEVRGCYLGPLGKVDHKHAVSLEGEEFTCEIDLFNAEKDRFPYPEEHFATVLCCELIEHLEQDPMFLMSEVNRVLKPGGHLVMTTPNIASLRAIKAILMGYHPGFFPAYLKPSPSGNDEARHAREYTPQEIMMMFLDAGFEMTLLETGPFRDLPRPEEHWIRNLLDRYLLSSQYRGDGIYAVGRKTGPVKERYPSWLYQ